MNKCCFANSPASKGASTFPTRRAGVLIQPAGRRWEHFHEVILHWFGAIVIVGMIAVLAIAYLAHRAHPDCRPGVPGEGSCALAAFERFRPLANAVSFVILGLTGLNITFGKIVLLPVIGPDTFSSALAGGQVCPQFRQLRLRDRAGPDHRVSGSRTIFHAKVDIEWLKEGGGFIKSKHAPAGRFNAGEKMVFWLALGAGIAVIASGYLLLFPFYVTEIAGMQIAQVIHAVVAVLLVALILAHIYIGTLGHGGRVRGDGQRRGGSQLGEGASRSLACP